MSRVSKIALALSAGVTSLGYYLYSANNTPQAISPQRVDYKKRS